MRNIYGAFISIAETFQPGFLIYMASQLLLPIFS